MSSKGHNLFNIPAHIGFVDALAGGILARIPDPMARARTLVLLPNRRAVRALTQAFVRALGAEGGMLLPRMVPVGDLGEDDFDRLAAGESGLAVAVPPLLRRLELARLVRQLPGGRTALEGLRLGDALGVALDALLSEEVPPEALRGAVADADLAHHWAETLTFLDVIIRHWPPVRDAMGAADGGTRLAAAIAGLAARWETSAPASPVVAAGIVSTTPALARLLAAVLTLPRGIVVLPGLDMDMSDAGQARWDAVHCAAASDDADGQMRESEAHPQFAVKQLLARLRRVRADVTDWGQSTAMDGPAARTSLVMAALAPADAGEGWAEADTDDVAAFAGVTVIEASTAAEEAQTIALALRRQVQTPGATAALVTPDRALARRVAAHCRRWGIEVDDSAGTPLTRTPPATLVLAMVEAVAGHFSPVRLLALLKHPLVQAGEGRLNWLKRVRQLDTALRGVRPAPGLDGVAAQIDLWMNDRRDRKRDRTLADWWADTSSLLVPLETLGETAEMTLPVLIDGLRAMVESLAGEALWIGTDGRALSERLEALMLDGGVFGPFRREEATSLLTVLLADVAVRPGWGGHPRVAILGPVEAQLARANLMILGGLNEGVWPAAASPDPWLAPAIRARLKLPGAARALGLAAQDFVRALGAPQVLITRARRDAGGPMRASRLLLRLDAFAARLGVSDDGLKRDDALLAIARGLDACAHPVPFSRPNPAPPAELRPQRLSVTEVDTLIADPFAFYAKHMLKLRPLDPLDADPGAADRGTLMHDVLEAWVKNGQLDAAALAQLTEAMLLSSGKDFPLLRALWGPRAARALRWAGETVVARMAEGWVPRAAEARGSLTLNNGVVIDGRADRIDLDDDGAYSIIDYKTGSPPKVANVRVGLANQLALLALMLERGGMRDGEAQLPAASVAALEYWQLSGSAKDAGKATLALGTKNAPPLDTHLTYVEETVTDFTSGLLLGNRPFRSNVHPALVWGDYNHLARVLEWRDRSDRKA